MFEAETKSKLKDKKRKALICAGLVTFIIAMFYIFLAKDGLYKFGSIGKEIAPVSSFIKDASQSVSEDIDKGKSVINKK